MLNKIIKQVTDNIKESSRIKVAILSDEKFIKSISEIFLITLEAYKNGNKTIFAGNGGSAADSNHISAEFVGRFNIHNRKPLNSISLSNNTSLITAIGNDYGFDSIFSRQIEAYGEKGDIFFALSTSGKSKNILEAIRICNNKEIITVGLTGDNISMDSICDYCIKVPSKETARIQEIHIMIGHLLIDFIEKNLFK